MGNIGNLDETKKVVTWLDDVLLTSYTSTEVSNSRPLPDLIFAAMGAAQVADQTYCVKVGDTLVDMEAADNAYTSGIIVTSGSIRTEEDARVVNVTLGRGHLILPSLVEVINLTLDGKLADKIRELNQQEG